MTLRHPRTVIGVVACTSALLLAGCSSDPAPPASTAPTSASASAVPTATASAAATPSTSSTLAAEKQQAVDEATATVLAYEQAFYDILADPTPDLNDINEVSTEPQLTLDLRSLQEGTVEIAQGKLVIESTGPVTLGDVEPIKVDLKSEPPVVVVEACVDRTATKTIYEGKPTESVRQLTRYRVDKTTYLPPPGWAVSRVLPPAGHDQPQPC